MRPWVDRYLQIHRSVLARKLGASSALWLSSNNGKALTYLGVEGVISKTTLATIGIDVSPHLFRSAGATTAAIYAGNNPHLGSALLHHRDPTITKEHYNRASSLSATQSYGALVRTLRAGVARPAGTSFVEGFRYKSNRRLFMSPFHGGNTGSIPVGRARQINDLRDSEELVVNA
jgi:hypothetical protein